MAGLPGFTSWVRPPYAILGDCPGVCECYTAPPRQKEVLDNLKLLRFKANIILIHIFNAFQNCSVIRCVDWKGLSSKHCYFSQKINNLLQIINNDYWHV